jgi:hypothetical protein
MSRVRIPSPALAIGACRAATCGPFRFRRSATSRAPLRDSLVQPGPVHRLLRLPASDLMLQRLGIRRHRDGGMAGLADAQDGVAADLGNRAPVAVLAARPDVIEPQLHLEEAGLADGPRPRDPTDRSPHSAPAGSLPLVAGRSRAASSPVRSSPARAALAAGSHSTKRLLRRAGSQEKLRGAGAGASHVSLLRKLVGTALVVLLGRCWSWRALPAVRQTSSRAP